MVSLPGNQRRNLPCGVTSIPDGPILYRLSAKISKYVSRCIVLVLIAPICFQGELRWMLITTYTKSRELLTLMVKEYPATLALVHALFLWQVIHVNIYKGIFCGYPGFPWRGLLYTVLTFDSCTKCAHRQLGYNTRPHARLPPSCLGMVAWMTSQLNVALIHQLRGPILCSAYFWHVIRGCLHNRVQELNVGGCQRI